MTVIRNEWLVTGDPGYGYPPYRFVFGNPYHASDDPEGDARRFMALAQDWVDGPHLHVRMITETPWEPV